MAVYGVCHCNLGGQQKIAEVEVWDKVKINQKQMISNRPVISRRRSAACRLAAWNHCV